MIKQSLILSLLLILTAACSVKPVYVQQPFLGFTTYSTPGDINVTVERNCLAKYPIGDYDTIVKVGDCVRASTVKELIVKIKKLERVAENYELDIKAYLRLHKDIR